MNSEKTIKNKRIPNAMKTLGTTAFRRTVWVPVIWSVLMVVLTVMMFDSYSYRYYNTVNPLEFADIFEELNELMPMYVVSIIFSALFGAMQFSFLTRVNSVGFVHSLPVTRNGIFASYYISGVVSVLIPQIILALSLVMIPWKYRLVYALLALAVGVVYSVGVYSFAVMMSMFAAKTIGCVLFASIGLAVPLLLENFIRIIMNTSLYGYFNESEYFVVRYVYLIPEQVMSPKGLIYVAAAVIFTFLAWLLYKRNHSELAGDLVAYPGIRGIATVICGLLAGVTGYLIFSGSLVLFAIFGAICAVLVNFAVRKKFELKSSAMFAGIMIGITLIIFAIFALDITGFEKRIPDIEDIKYARVYARYRRNDYVGYNEDDVMLYRNGNASDIRSKEGLETVIEFHKEMLDNEDYYASGYYEIVVETYSSTRPYNGSSYDPNTSQSFIIEYTLDDGRKLIRNYRAYHGKNREILMKIASLPETKVYDHPIIRNDIKTDYLRIEAPTGLVTLTGTEAELIREALAEDIINAPAELERGFGDFRSISAISLNFEYHYSVLYDEAGRKITDNATLGLFNESTHEYLYPHYTRTIKVLRDLGYGHYIDFGELGEGFTVSIEKHKAQSSDIYPKTDVYYPQVCEDPGIITQIMRYSFAVSDDICDPVYDTAYRISYKRGGINDESFMIYGEVDFIEEWLATKAPEKDYTAGYDGVPYSADHRFGDKVIYERQIW